jgi:hypothetical protein
VGGTLAAPIYAMFQIQDEIDASGYKAPDGSVPQAYWIGPPPNDRYSAWEWSGEWTVTYETFRDMGAAFMVALVLIYILVVWEFGNFRIPLVIMAPIPLTLLGIIPAHLIMFALGLGGEFTATSMIGWIALAGIIVRNSILLVDFSVHEVQKGVPVAESVIRACKTRTRPIVITALALVAGSGVIFFDPIFQGMAISLASGVLVSTILTLVVIPLGCVAASKDLCEVAAATAPSGATVPCSTEEAERKQQKEKKPKGSALIKVWGYVVEGIVLIFYAIRGIFLLLIDFVKGFLKKKKPAAKPAPRPAPAGGTGGAAPAPVASTPGSDTAPLAGAAGTAPGGAAARERGADPTAARVPQSRQAAPEKSAESADSPNAAAPPPAPVTGGTAEEKTDSPRGSSGKTAPAGEDSGAGGAGPAAPPEDFDAVAAAEKRASATTEVAAKSSKKAAKGKRTGAKKRVSKTAATKSEKTQAALVQKKAPRRGIRLKVDDGQGPSFD